MFDNIAEKIKSLAVVVFVLSCISGVIGFIASFNASPILGLAIILAAPIVGYTSALLIYGFGELIENTQYSYFLAKKQLPASNKETFSLSKNKTPTQKTTVNTSAITTEPWYCEKCGTKMPGANKACLSCGAAKPE